MNTQKQDSLRLDDIQQQDDLSNTQVKRESKYEKHDVEGTPFTVIEEPVGEYDSEFHVTLGKYRMGTFVNLEDAMENALEMNWEKIIQVIGILIESDKQMEKQKINEIEVAE